MGGTRLRDQTRIRHVPLENKNVGRARVRVIVLRLMLVDGMSPKVADLHRGQLATEAFRLHIGQIRKLAIGESEFDLGSGSQFLVNGAAVFYQAGLLDHETNRTVTSKAAVVHGSV